MNTVTQNTEKKFQNYSSYANAWLKENEIKLKTVYVTYGNYNENFIYLNRVGNCNKAKYRVLIKGRDKVKNCIMITFNFDRHDKNYLEYKIKSYLPLLSHWAQGTCQKFITQNMIAEMLSGSVDTRGKMNESVLY